jgi:hypothetical protein
MTRLTLLFFLLLSLATAGCRAAPAAPGELTVYFTDVARYAVGEEPFETAVTRTVAGDAYLPAAVLTEFFKGLRQTGAANRRLAARPCTKKCGRRYGNWFK